MGDDLKMDDLWPEWESKHTCHYDLYVTGHSLGAAAADLFSWSTADLAARTKVYTFGLPVLYDTLESVNIVNANTANEPWRFVNIVNGYPSDTANSYTDRITSLMGIASSSLHRTMGTGLLHGFRAKVNGSPVKATVQVTIDPSSYSTFCGNTNGHWMRMYKEAMEFLLGTTAKCLKDDGETSCVEVFGELYPLTLPKGNEPSVVYDYMQYCRVETFDKVTQQWFYPEGYTKLSAAEFKKAQRDNNGSKPGKKPSSNNDNGSKPGNNPSSNNDGKDDADPSSDITNPEDLCKSLTKLGVTCDVPEGVCFDKNEGKKSKINCKHIPCKGNKTEAKCKAGISKDGTACVPIYKRKRKVKVFKSCQQFQKGKGKGKERNKNKG